MKSMVREREIAALVDAVRRKESVVLSGNAGVGKRTLFEEASKTLNMPIVELNVMELVLASDSVEDLERRVEMLLENATGSGKLLFIPAVEQLKVIEDSCTYFFSASTNHRSRILNYICSRVGRKEIHCVATTTDLNMLSMVSAFSAWFTVVDVPDMSVDEAVIMLCADEESLSDHVGVELDEKTIEAAVKLTHNHFPRQQLPAKAVELIEEVSSHFGYCDVGALVRKISLTTRVDTEALLSEL